MAEKTDTHCHWDEAIKHTTRVKADKIELWSKDLASYKLSVLQNEVDPALAWASRIEEHGTLVAR